MSWFAANVSGLWTTTATWVSSSTNSGATTGSAPWAAATTIPQPGDIVFLNGKIVTLPSSDYAVNVGGISAEIGSSNTFGTTNVIVGGNIQGAAAGTWTYQITASQGIIAGTVSANALSMIGPGATGQTINVTASKIDGTKYTNTAQGVLDGRLTNTTYNIVCDSIVGPGAGGVGIFFLFSGATTLNIRSNITGSSVTTGAPIWIQSTGTNNITITGSLKTTSTGQVIYYNNTNLGGSINILGNIDASTSTGAAINIGPNGGITINGNVTGGTLASAITFTNSSATLGITVTGNVTAGSGVVPAISNTIAVPITVTGTVTAGVNSPGIISTTSTGLVTVYGSIVNVNGFQGVQSQRLILSSSAATAMAWTWQDTAGNNITYSPSTANITYPDPAAVRQGASGQTSTGTSNGTLVVPAVTDVRETVSYDNGTKTGTMRVPSYLDVRSGVAVDSGSGAIIMPTAAQVQSGVTFDSGSSKTGTYDGVAAFWGYSTASMSAGSIGALITQSLDVRIGTITGSLVTELDNTAITSNTVRRMQNAATVQTTGDQLSSYNT